MHEARTKIIYGIYASDLKSIGYVGQTSDLARRSHRHLNISTRKPRNIDIWIELQNKNVVFITLEECEWVDAGKKESYWKSILNPIVKD